MNKESKGKGDRLKNEELERGGGGGGGRLRDNVVFSLLGSRSLVHECIFSLSQQGKPAHQTSGNSFLTALFPGPTPYVLQPRRMEKIITCKPLKFGANGQWVITKGS